MTLLKDLGYGRKYVEARIGIEMEVLVEKIRKLDGRSFTPKDILYQCNNGIIMSFMFGRQFDYDSDPLMQHINTYTASVLVVADPKLNLFPVLAYLPKYRRRLDEAVDSHK
jgi:cytochrome P450 family 2 subfamily C